MSTSSIMPQRMDTMIADRSHGQRRSELFAGHRQVRIAFIPFEFATGRLMFRGPLLGTTVLVDEPPPGGGGQGRHSVVVQAGLATRLDWLEGETVVRRHSSPFVEVQAEFAGGR